MKYTVVWLPTAEDRLADIWNKASDQQAAADAADRIDRELYHDPETKGQPQGKFRTLTIPPLAVLFLVVPDDRKAIVIDVKRI